MPTTKAVAEYCFVYLALALVHLYPTEAQSPSERDTGASSATHLPLSGVAIPSQSVSVTQRTTNVGGGNSVNVIDSSVAVPNPFNGSTPLGPAVPGQILLSLQHALELGLHFNLGAINESQAVLEAEGTRRVARSSLLPTLNTVISEQLEKLNLRTQGVESPNFPVTAQFNFFDARVARLNQTVFDLVRIDNLHSATENLHTNLKAAKNARDLIVLAVAGTYLQLIATQARVIAATAQVTTARAIDQQAADRLAAGLSARIDSMRARVQMQTEEQRLRSLKADFDTQKLRLARIIGLPLGQQFTIADEYHYAPVSGLTLDTALARAENNRQDIQSAASALKAAEDALKAAHAERLPNLTVAADYGAAGLRPTTDASSVWTVSGTLTIPIWEGGRIRGDIDQATAVFRQRQAELQDVRAQVDQDVRQAFIDLNSAADQVDVARSNVDLAHATLEQSRDRFSQGVADSVELVQAEQTVVQADDDYITAAYEHNLAKVSLARAMGNAEQSLPQMLRK